MPDYQPLATVYPLLLGLLLYWRNRNLGAVFGLKYLLGEGVDFSEADGGVVGVAGAGGFDFVWELL